MIRISKSMKIDAPREAFVDWISNIDKNYKAWDPEHHVQCKFLTEKPLKEGSILYFEEYFLGKLQKIRYKIICADRDKRIEVQALFPQSLIGGRLIFEMEPEGNGFILTETIGLGFDTPVVGALFDIIIRTTAKRFFPAFEDHLVEGLENIKRILEQAD